MRVISYLSDNVTQFIKYFVRITELLLIAFALDDERVIKRERENKKKKNKMCVVKKKIMWRNVVCEREREIFT